MKDFFQEIYQTLHKGIALVVVTIISDSGSTPRTSGSKMIVYDDGRISGTVGGGAVEGDVIQKSLNLFTTQRSDIVSYNLNQSVDLAQMDLICGGRMQVLLEYVPVDKSNLEMYRMVYEQIQRFGSCLWVGRVDDDAGNLKVSRALHTAEQGWIGSFQLNDALLELPNEAGRNSVSTFWVENGEERYVVESIQPPETVYLIGGGHVSKEIALLTKQVGFRTVVVDDRTEFANIGRFKDVDEVRVCPGYIDVFRNFDINANSYIIIVTRGHSFDKEVLGQALQTNAGYIGMIGSRRKRQSIYQALLTEGFEQRFLEQVYCPIGLPIDAETPAEIAISVVAQLVQHRAGRKIHG